MYLLFSSLISTKNSLYFFYKFSKIYWHFSFWVCKFQWIFHPTHW